MGVKCVTALWHSITLGAVEIDSPATFQYSNGGSDIKLSELWSDEPKSGGPLRTGTSPTFFCCFFFAISFLHS